MSNYRTWNQLVVEFYLNFLESDLTYSEVAEALDLPVHVVKWRIKEGHRLYKKGACYAHKV